MALKRYNQLTQLYNSLPTETLVYAAFFYSDESVDIDTEISSTSGNVLTQRNAWCSGHNTCLYSYLGLDYL